MPMMTEKRYEYFGGRNLRNCLCCGRRVKVGERYILVSLRVGIQHVDTCPRSLRPATNKEGTR